MRALPPIRGYLRNELTNEYRVVLVDRIRLTVESGLPDDWDAYPMQYLRNAHPNNRTRVIHCPCDMRGWLLRKVRLSLGLTQTELAHMIGKAHASSVSRYEDYGIPDCMRQRVYAALGVDHRPGIADTQQLKAIVQFLGCSYREISRWTHIGRTRLITLMNGAEWKANDKNRLYSLYAMLPNLEDKQQ